MNSASSSRSHSPALDALVGVLDPLGSVAVAVSGGVDSMTLAHVVADRLGTAARMLHAVSPAVPEEATARVQRHALLHDWQLTLLDAGEFADPDYRRNPVNRCFYCKQNLYTAMAAETDAVLVSGTNLDDLGDYRPGLQAAEHQGVRHPFVEAGIDKAGVRRLARDLGLDDLAELPASPCLSSRIETGIAIRATDLGFVHRVEGWLNANLGAATARCRIRAGGPTVELDAAALARLQAPGAASLRGELLDLFLANGYQGLPALLPYRRGSAFLR